MPDPDDLDAKVVTDGSKAHDAEQLLQLVYDELRELASAYLTREPSGHTLQATALVHEAFVRVQQLTEIQWTDATHFYAVAARAMRRVLVDHARRKVADKRGGRARQISVCDEAESDETSVLEIVALEEALAGLQKRSERQARIVEMRFFGGMSVQEVARALQLSERTVAGEWRVARAWLNRELGGRSVD